ncbi:hypothetical protein VNO78_21525 [Psophocarpus tetragonolobus]|uniref:Legume lectin domain-containing protein n=1 Tax=Psophocarpus tetragonolobus TaxID=3891 RepID=A0AAN9SB83_PSOTE
MVVLYYFISFSYKYPTQAPFITITSFYLNFNHIKIKLMAFSKSFSFALPLSLAFFLVLLTQAHSILNTVSFTFNKFVPGQSNLILQGDTVITETGKLQLTNVNSNGVPTPASLGRALYAAPVQIWDNETGVVASWATSFSFKIFAPNKSNTADGIAFFLAPVGSQPRTKGGFLGLFDNEKYNKNVQTVAVEFDTFWNPRWDPRNAHIGIDVNSIRSIKTASWGLANGQIAKILITYDASTSLLVASLVHPSRRKSYILSETVNLKNVLPQWVSVGFSATTGIKGSVETHDVHSWSFASKLSDATCAYDHGVDLASFMLHEAI